MAWMNDEAFREEMQRQGEIVKRNRHNAHTGQWYGPDMELSPPGPLCSCSGCGVRYREGRGT